MIDELGQDASRHLAAELRRFEPGNAGSLAGTGLFRTGGEFGGDESSGLLLLP
jgi:hypothetical protein